MNQNQFGNSMMNPMNNQFGNQYQSRFYPTQNGIIWVQGIEGAKAYQLAPNSNTVLLDSENDGIFYIKVSDNIGMCSLRLFRFEEITEQPSTQATVDMSMYVRRDELEQLLKQFEGGKVDGEQVISTNESKPKSNAKPKSLITE